MGPIKPKMSLSKLKRRSSKKYAATMAALIAFSREAQLACRASIGAGGSPGVEAVLEDVEEAYTAGELRLLWSDDGSLVVFALWPPDGQCYFLWMLRNGASLFEKARTGMRLLNPPHSEDSGSQQE